MAFLQIAYNIDVVKSNIPEALEVLSDAVLNPRFTTWEVAEAVQKIEQDIRGLKENPQTVLLEASIHSISSYLHCMHAWTRLCLVLGDAVRTTVLGSVTCFQLCVMLRFVSHYAACGELQHGLPDLCQLLPLFYCWDLLLWSM